MINPFKIGFGYDVHKLAENRKLIIGGIELEHPKGLDGHSDADVLLHAICDALLGALALGDIGKHFPNTDLKFKDIDSRILLLKTYDLIKDNGYILGNIDSTVVIQEPKIAPYIPSMRKVIAEILSAGVEQISIKATTSEGLGYEGRGEGVSAFAIVLLIKKEN
ncbi:MAG TPA: 2-C-methyl-D-erythritol 2,4-cyclodiphosphate synthase [Melioribacteraceae bacterium]|nr:2-C-methyl-D-erythritol 2,4-cyclodiphosphate synthase [Melioribacteraceae bacterium]